MSQKGIGTLWCERCDRPKKTKKSRHCYHCAPIYRAGERNQPWFWCMVHGRKAEIYNAANRLCCNLKMQRNCRLQQVDSSVPNTVVSTRQVGISSLVIVGPKGDTLEGALASIVQTPQEGVRIVGNATLPYPLHVQIMPGWSLVKTATLLDPKEVLQAVQYYHDREGCTMLLREVNDAIKAQNT